MKRYSVSKSTIIKWQRREDVEDRSHRAHTLHTTLSAAQELIVVELRRLLELPLDDLLVVTRRFINPDASRSGLSRLLPREGLESLCALLSELCQQTRFASAAQLEQTLKDYLMAYNHFIPQQTIGHQSPVQVPRFMVSSTA
jgi:hypothetical protein